MPPRASAERKQKLLALSPRLDELLAARVKELGATGAVTAIVLEGEPIYQRSFGVRDVESRAPIDDNTLFRLGSVSKTITALAILRLRDQGKVVLDEPAATYLPALHSVVLPTKDSPSITVRHLLTMTSGLGYDDLWGAVTFGYSDQELAELFARSPTFGGAPGERYRYSNLGYALLGKVVERASGRRFEDYVKSEIFRPLGMTSSGYVTTGMPRDRSAVGYYRDAERLVPEPVPSDGVFAAAGGAYTSLHDLARYAAFQLAAYPPRDDPETGAVRRSTLREMHQGRAWARWADDLPVLTRTPDGALSLSAASYGFGWSQNSSCLAEGMVQHGGFEPGYFAVVRILPRQGLAVAMMSTTANLGQLRTFESLVALLREAGVFEATAPSAPAALVTARDTVVSLLEKWDAELAARAFDQATQRYSFVRSFRSDMERMGREHGRCRPEGDVVPLSLSHGRFRLACERGAIEFLTFLTPHTTPLIQMVEWRRELPVTDEEQGLANRLLAAIARSSRLPPGLVTPGTDRQALEKRLVRLNGGHGRCTLERPLSNDGKGEASFRLRCGGEPVDLFLRLDSFNERIADLRWAEPRAFGATCAE